MKFFTMGLPETESQPIYGLYQPVLDTFLAVTDSEVVAQDVKFLMSRRYNLHTIRLDQSENYTHNIIDNTVCENWTLSNKGDARLTLSLTDLPIVSARRLVEKKNRFNWDIDKEKEYIQLCLFFARFFNQYTPLPNYSNLNNALADVVPIAELDDFTHPYAKKKEVFNILYFEQDHDSAVEKITKLIDASLGFTKEFNTYYSKYV